MLIVATGIEEINKLQVQLKSLYDQLQVNLKEIAIPQQFQKDIDASYRQCFTVARKIKREQSTLKEDIEKLTKEKNQLMNEKHQLLDQIEHLTKELVKRGILKLLLIHTLGIILSR